jgi:hypothetical protein
MFVEAALKVGGDAGVERRATSHALTLEQIQNPAKTGIFRHFCV